MDLLGYQGYQEWHCQRVTVLSNITSLTTWPPVPLQRHHSYHCTDTTLTTAPTPLVPLHRHHSYPHRWQSWLNPISPGLPLNCLDAVSSDMNLIFLAIVVHLSRHLPLAEREKLYRSTSSSLHSTISSLPDLGSVLGKCSSRATCHLITLRRRKTDPVLADRILLREKTRVGLSGRVRFAQLFVQKPTFGRKS